MKLPDAPPTTCTPEETRSILRSLRDLNLVGARFEVRAGETVAIRGCVSMDSPVEQGVRYSLRLSDGRDAVLRISASDGSLHLGLDGADVEQRELIALLARGAGDLAECSALGARIDPHTASRRDLEHFLRRIVRGVMAA
ncbi:MAG: hypothetical protein ACI841_001620 [Planctomycetota bacterium]|jgi:hypothetical protein